MIDVRSAQRTFASAPNCTLALMLLSSLRLEPML